jgi:hypothetical protein
VRGKEQQAKEHEEWREKQNRSRLVRAFSSVRNVARAWHREKVSLNFIVSHRRSREASSENQENTSERENEPLEKKHKCQEQGKNESEIDQVEEEQQLVEEENEDALKEKKLAGELDDSAKETVSNNETPAIHLLSTCGIPKESALAFVELTGIDDLYHFHSCFHRNDLQHVAV